MLGWKKNTGGMKRATEVSAAWDGGLTRVNTGLIAGTKVATPTGWTRVEEICVGDVVLTFDGGFQTVISTRRAPVWNGMIACPDAKLPLNVPAGALGNRDAMQILPQQSVMIESDIAEEAFGDPFVLIPAAALVGFRGIERGFGPDQGEVIALHFAEDQIVFANIGALFLCPAAGDILSDVFTDPNAAPAYKSLSMAQADSLIACIEMDDMDDMTHLAVNYAHPQGYAAA